MSIPVQFLALKKNMLKVFRNSNIWPVKSVKTVISQILSDFSENLYTCSVFDPEQEYVKSF